MECTYFEVHLLFFVKQAHLYIAPRATLSVGHAPRANSAEFHGSPSHPRADDFNPQECVVPAPEIAMADSDCFVLKYG